ncbi:sushi, nidogen and EGF-like domain-containing protein 1 isoform X2 [Taeniopygia guttata]
MSPSSVLFLLILGSMVDTKTSPEKDVDNMLGGDIFYHQTTDLALLEDISQHIIQSFPKSPFTPTWALMATWDHVAYYGSTSEKAVLTTDSKMFYIILN